MLKTSKTAFSAVYTAKRSDHFTAEKNPKMEKIDWTIMKNANDG